MSTVSSKKGTKLKFNKTTNDMEKECGKSDDDKEKMRVQFDMSKEAVGQLDNLRKKIHSSSRAHVIRKSLALFDWILDSLERGYSIYLEKNGERERIVIPDLKS